MSRGLSNAANRAVAVVGLLFFVSGMPALIYQVAWQRILCLHSGSGIYSIAIIVAAFMLGLGIGSEAGGALSSRCTRRRALLFFALAEMSTGLFALGSCWLYYDVLYAGEFWVQARWWQLMTAHFAALAVPTTLMGMTFPLLARATVYDTDHASWTVSRLYAANTLGAAVGAALTPWVLLAFLGIRGSVTVGAALNFIVGCGAVVVLWRSREFAKSPAAPSRPPSDVAAMTVSKRAVSTDPPLSLAWWGVLYGLSGFIALGLEIVWFRLLDVAIKSNSLTYGTVLSVYLAGLAFGSWLGGRYAAQCRQPLIGFLVCQCSLLIWAAAAVLVLVHVPPTWRVVAVLMDYWRQYEGLGLRSLSEWRLALLLYLALPAGMYFFPTALMGLSFSFLQRAVHNDPQASGQTVGTLQFANIVGSTLGSLAVGLAGLNLLGSVATLRVLLCAGCCFALLGVFRKGVRSIFTVLAGVLLVLVLRLPDATLVWSRLHGLPAESMIVREDASGVAVIGPSAAGDQRVLWLNGKGQASLPFGGIHITLGALPALMHPYPADVAVIGLGGGGTAYAASCRPETTRVRIFEICSALLELQDDLAQYNSETRFPELLGQSNVALIAADGRNAIVNDTARYDVIEADAIRSDGAFSGNIYSVEFFQSCAARLKPGGLFCTWTPSLAVRRAFSDAFPYVVSFDGPYLIGSPDPIIIDHEALRERLRWVAARSWLRDEWIENVRRELSTCAPYDRQEVEFVLPNRDLFPRDEFDAARYAWTRLGARLPFADRLIQAPAEAVMP